jgi:hypothetical protein
MNDIKRITYAWMEHQGYTPGEIQEGEEQTCANSGCNYIDGLGYAEHEDEDGKSLHPISDELSHTAELVMFTIENLQQDQKKQL